MISEDSRNLKMFFDEHCVQRTRVQSKKFFEIGQGYSWSKIRKSQKISISNLMVFTETPPLLAISNPASVRVKIIVIFSSKWQYFTATIVSFDKISLEYEINWDDNDPTGRIVHYSNIAIDQVPDEKMIAIGSDVLFSQGQYKLDKLLLNFTKIIQNSLIIRK